MTKKENTLRAIRLQNPEYVPYELDCIVDVASPVIERPLETGLDSFGSHWTLKEDAHGGTYPTEINFVLTDIENWREQVVFPKIDDFDWSEKLALAATVNRDEELLQGFCEMGIFERIYTLMGMENALIAFYTDEEKIAELCDAIADYKIEVLDRMIEVLNPDMIWYGDDWGSQTNLLMAPELWRRTIKPATKKIYDFIASKNILINQHSCGKVESIIGDLCDIGVNMWNPCQPCNDLKMLKQEYGDRMAFCGGIDSQFVLDNENATLKDVENEVKKRIHEMTSAQGGYVASPSHSIPYEQSKLDTMVFAIDKYGREYLEHLQKK